MSGATPVICRFTHDASLVADGYRLVVVRDDGRIFAFHREKPAWTIVGMVQLREGVVHALCTDGSVCQVTTSDASAEDFQVQIIQ